MVRMVVELGIKSLYNVSPSPVFLFLASCPLKPAVSSPTDSGALLCQLFDCHQHLAQRVKFSPTYACRSTCLLATAPSPLSYTQPNVSACLFLRDN